MMLSESQIMEDDSDSDCSEATANSSSNNSVGSSDESLGELGASFEVAKILNERFHLPKDLCEDPAIFSEFFSLETWNNLAEETKASLVANYLPDFPTNNHRQKQLTIHQLFTNKLTRFNHTPLDTFQNNLQDGNYRPDIAQYRASIQKAEEREQRFQECERITLLAEKLVLSREKHLRSVYRAPPSNNLQTNRKPVPSIPKLSSTAATMRAKRRYFQEISALSEEIGLTMSDDENYPEGPPAPLTKKQKKQLLEIQGSASPGADIKIFSTTSSIKDNSLDYLLGSSMSDDCYRQMLHNHKKRKAIEPDHPELEIEDIKLKDIFTRTQLVLNPKKINFAGPNATITKKANALEAMRIKQEPPVILPMKVQASGSQSMVMLSKNQLNSPMKVVKNTVPMRVNIQKNSGMSAVQHSDDEEDWIKTNIIKVEPRMDGTSTASKMDHKLTMKATTKVKTVFPVPQQHQQTLVVNRKRPIMNNEALRAGKKIIIDAGNVIKGSYTTITHKKDDNVTIVHNNNSSNIPFTKMKSNNLMDLKGVDLMQLEMNAERHSDDSSDMLEKSPELKSETQACFLSLIRDIFCSTHDHRMKLEELRRKISVWLRNPVASENEWYGQTENWALLLISAVHFLSGEFIDQPEDFVPYLEFKAQLNIYQWIGAGRDSDNRLMALCQYWLSRRDEMGIRAKHKDFSKNIKTIISPERNEDSHLHRSVTPPLPRCRTEWKVSQAMDEEIRVFRVQERRRYENPHMAFTYRQHGYESVVAPLKGIYTHAPGVSKARDHNTLVADRPNFVTILSLVRDATARLPNGEGTRWDICELLRSSQYLAPNTSDSVLQTIVSGALDRMHAENDPCVKYDTKRKLWIYLHRNRSEADFDRLHHQQQGMTKMKKPIVRKIKTGAKDEFLPNPTRINSNSLLNQSHQQVITISSNPMRIISKPNTITKNYHPKIVPSTSMKPLPALTTFENKQKLTLMSSSASPPLKRVLKQSHVNSDKNLEMFDVEASLDAHTSPIIVKASTVDNKVLHKFQVKNADGKMQQMSPIRIITSVGGGTTYHQSPVLGNNQQSILINTQRSNSPKIATIIGNKKMAGKPVPPLVSQSSPNTGQNYVINLNQTKMMKPNSEPPALTATSQIKHSILQQNKNQGIVRINASTGKTIMTPTQQHSPQQRIVLTSSPVNMQNKGKVISTVTIPKTQTQATITPILSHQKQILQNVLVQQQKTKNNTLILNQQQQNLNLQKVPALTTTSNSQVFQIQQTQADGKHMTVSTANLTPQQRQSIFQSLKQLNLKQSGNAQQSLIVKPQLVHQSVKSVSLNQDLPTPPLVSVSGTVPKIIKAGTTTMAQHSQQIFTTTASRTSTGMGNPLMAKVMTSSGATQLISIDGLLQKPGTTFKLANTKPGGQTGLIQIAGQPGSQITQYAVVSKGKNIITMGQQRFVTTQANIANNTKLIAATSSTAPQTVATSSGNVIITSPQMTTQQTSQSGQQIKIVQGGQITQQLINAKLINMQGLANKAGIKTGGIKMINAQNYIANIGGKQMIIAGKPNTSTATTTPSGQGIVLQSSGTNNGASYILNAQGQPMKVQGNILTQPITSQTQTMMVGNQLVKVQSLNQLQNKGIVQTAGSMNADGRTNQPLILGSNFKLLKNVIKTTPNQPQQQRMVLTTPGGQAGQYTQQIILPANFQGGPLNIKTLQGLKVIPMAQQGTFARLLTTSNTNTVNSTSNSNSNNNNNINNNNNNNGTSNIVNTSKPNPVVVTSTNSNIHEDINE